MDRVVTLVQSAIAASFASYGRRIWTHPAGGLDETAEMIERLAGEAPPLSEQDFRAWVARRIS